jgi:hypothetical protein
MLESLQELSTTATNANDTNLSTSLAKFKGLLHFLKTKNEEIPLFVAGSLNFGHQRTSVAVLRRLMVMGATKFRLVYEESNASGAHPQDPSAATKLTTLLPGLTESAISSTTSYQYTYGGCQADLLFTLDKNVSTLGTKDYLMGFTGGYDIPKATICDKLLAYFTTVLQPFAYNKHFARNTIFSRSKLRTTNVGSNIPECLDLPPEFFNKFGFYIEDPIRPDSFLDQTQTKPEVEWQRQVINAVLEKVKAGTADLCPVYFSEGRTSANTPTILFNLIAGIFNAKKQASTGLTIGQKVTVVLNISPFPEDVYKVLQYLYLGTQDEWDEKSTNKIIQQIRKWSPMMTRSTWAYLNSAGYFTDFNDIELLSQSCPTTNNVHTTFNAAFQAASPNGIVVVDLRKVPNSVFEYLFAQGTLPALFEGEGSASLMLNLGEPFFHLTAYDSDSYSIYPDMVELGTKSVIDRCRKMFTNFQDSAWQAAINPDDAIGEFIIDAYKSGTELNRYFKNIREHFHNEANDKVHRAIPFLLAQLKNAQGKGEPDSMLNSDQW